MDIPLRFTYFDLSDSSGRIWDTNNNQCVIDYLRYEFENKKGLIKVMNIDNLKKEF